MIVNGFTTFTVVGLMACNVQNIISRGELLFHFRAAALDSAWNDEFSRGWNKSHSLPLLRCRKSFRCESLPVTLIIWRARLRAISIRRCVEEHLYFVKFAGSSLEKRWSSYYRVHLSYLTKPVDQWFFLSDSLWLCRQLLQIIARAEGLFNLKCI